PYYDNQRGILQNVHGVVDNARDSDATGLAPLYTSGWLKRGPSGIIGTNIADAKDTVASIMKDIQDDNNTSAREAKDSPPSLPLQQLLEDRGVQVVDWKAYLRINDKEMSPSHKRNPEQPREKITEWQELLLAAKATRQRSANLLVDEEEEKELVIQQLGYLPSNFVRVSAWSTLDGGGGENDGDDDDDDDDTSTDRRLPLAIQTYPLQGGAKRRQAKAAVDVGGNDNGSGNKSVNTKSNVQSPFPTLFWLASSEVAKAVGDLERRGFIQECHEKIVNDSEMSRRLLQCHFEYALLRWASLSEEDRSSLDASTIRDDSDSSPSTKSPIQGMRDILLHSGISGTNLTGFVLPEEILSGGNDSESVNSKRCVSVASPLEIPPIKCLHAHFAHYLSSSSAFGVDNNAMGDGHYTRSSYATNPVGELIHEQLAKEYPKLGLGAPQAATG
ncbi:MAG: hypothetical protein SGILL_004266, partial [Bacillariaceae sp.]